MITTINEFKKSINENNGDFSDYRLSETQLEYFDTDVTQKIIELEDSENFEDDELAVISIAYFESKYFVGVKNLRTNSFYGDYFVYVSNPSYVDSNTHLYIEKIERAPHGYPSTAIPIARFDTDNWEWEINE